MPRRAAKVDSNQKEIVKALRDAGASVEPLHAVGGGVPDLLVGFRKKNYLIEVIGEEKLKRFRKNGGLSDNQVEWHDAWLGDVYKVETIEDALFVIGVHLTSVPLLGSIE